MICGEMISPLGNGRSTRRSRICPVWNKPCAQHAEALEQHAAAIRLYEQEFLGHEHNVSEYERRNIPLRLLKRAQTHAEEAEQHRTQSQVHEEFEKAATPRVGELEAIIFRSRR